MTTTLTTSTGPNEVLRAQLYEQYGLTCPPRWGTPRSSGRQTYGGKIAKIARALGTPLMPWQRYVADVALEIDPETGVFAYRGIDLTVPRQSGKTSLILPVAVHRGMAWQRQRVIYGAQTGTAAREKWEDEHVPLLQDAKAFKGKFRVRKANGREAIIWRATRSIHSLTTNTEKATHGKTLDLALLDEYFAQVDYRLDQATGPAMITRPMAQKWRLSTAGTSKSLPFNAMRTRGRAAIESGRASKIAFFDWCALPGMARDDPAVWRDCMPALCPAPVRGVCRCAPGQWRHTVTDEAIRAELEDLADTPEEFDRAYLNISREDGELDTDPNVPSTAEWDLLADDRADGGGIVAIAVDITPQRDSAAIVAAGYTPAGLPRVVVLEHGPGTAWILDSILALHDELQPVAWALDDKSATGTLILPLERHGIVRQEQEPRRGQLWIPTVQHLGAACGSFTDTVRQGQLVHLGQEELTIALDGARTRPLGDGAWAWGRKIGSADISPLVAATLALAALERFAQLANPAAGAATANTASTASGNGLWRPTSRLSL